MNNKRKIFIGSRKSNLAIEQASLVKKKLKEVGLSSLFVKSITSRGDKVSYKNFKLEGGKGLFTKDIDDLLINKKHGTNSIIIFTMFAGLYGILITKL